MNNPGEIRLSTAIGYLSDARSRPNLTLLADTPARRVVLEGTRAVGVELESASGDVSVVSAGEEIGRAHV